MSFSEGKLAEAPPVLEDDKGGALPEESPAAGNVSHSKAVLRYHKDYLLKCAKSPLATKPERLPPKEAWFGELLTPNFANEADAGAPRDGQPKDVPHINTLGPMLASLMNNKECSLGGMRADKNIVLGPPKLNFASSQKQGFANYKNVEENGRHSGASRGSRHNVSDVQQDLISRQNEYVSRQQRDPGERERGSGPRRGGFSDRHGQLLGHGGHGHARDSGHGQSRDGPAASRAPFGQSRDRVGSDAARFASKTGTSARTASPERELNDSATKERNPDWVNYDSLQESGAGAFSLSGGSGIDKIQLWKQQMKELEQKEREEKILRAKGISRADASQSWRAELAKSLEAPVAERESGDRAAEDKTRNLEFTTPREVKPRRTNDIDAHFFGPGLGFSGTQFESPQAQPSDGVGASTETGSRFSKLFRKAPESDAKEHFDALERKTSGERLMDILRSKMSGGPALSVPVSNSVSAPARRLQVSGRVFTEEEVIWQLGGKVPPGTVQDPESGHVRQHPETEEDLMPRLGARGPPNAVSSAEPPSERRAMTGEDLLRRLGPSLSQTSASRSFDSLKSRGAMTEDEMVRQMNECSKPPEASGSFNMLMDKLTRGMAVLRPSDDKRTATSAMEEWRTAGGSPDEQRSTGATGAPRTQFSEESSPLAAFVKGAKRNTESPPPPPTSVDSVRPRPNLVLDGSVPTSVYRQLSGKADSVKASAATGAFAGRLSSQATDFRPVSPAEPVPVQQHLQNHPHVVRELYRQQQQQQQQQQRGYPQPNSLQNLVSGGAKLPPQPQGSRPLSASHQQIYSAAQPQQQIPPSAQARIEQFFRLAPLAQQRPMSSFLHDAPISTAQSMPPGIYGYQQQHQVNQHVNQMQAPLQHHVGAAYQRHLTEQLQLTRLLPLHQQHQHQQAQQQQQQPQHHHPQQPLVNHYSHQHQHQPQPQQFFRLQPPQPPQPPPLSQNKLSSLPQGYIGGDGPAMLPGSGGFFDNTPLTVSSNGMPSHPQGYLTVEELERRRLGQTPYHARREP